MLRLGNVLTGYRVNSRATRRNVLRGWEVLREGLRLLREDVGRVLGGGAGHLWWRAGSRWHQCICGRRVKGYVKVRTGRKKAGEKEKLRTN